MKTTRDDEELERLFLEVRVARLQEKEWEDKIDQQEKLLAEMKLGSRGSFNRARAASDALWKRLDEMTRPRRTA